MPHAIHLSNLTVTESLHSGPFDGYLLIFDGLFIPHVFV